MTREHVLRKVCKQAALPGMKGGVSRHSISCRGMGFEISAQTALFLGHIWLPRVYMVVLKSQPCFSLASTDPWILWVTRLQSASRALLRQIQYKASWGVENRGDARGQGFLLSKSPGLAAVHSDLPSPQSPAHQWSWHLPGKVGAQAWRESARLWQERWSPGDLASSYLPLVISELKPGPSPQARAPPHPGHLQVVTTPEGSKYYSSQHLNEAVHVA